jgi:hypothetical protein
MEFRERSYSRGADDKQLKPTTRMNDETWERFKPLLCGLYKQYTLNVVMEYMEKKYKIVQRYVPQVSYGILLGHWLIPLLEQQATIWLSFREMGSQEV